MKFGTTEDPAIAVVPSAPGGPKRIKQGSPQQEAFWEALRNDDGHLLVEARAGAGKSSSSREGMFRLLDDDPDAVIRYCCFNKSIADEFGRGCPPGVEVGTMHRFGLLAVQKAFNSRIDEQKTYTLLDQLGGTDLKRYVRRAIKNLVSLAKNHGHRPDTPGLKTKLLELLDAFDIETYHNDEAVLAYAARLIQASAETTSFIDFDDMLWLPVLHGLQFPGVDFLFIDECQDLNPIQHELAIELSGSGRTVIVGDPYQAIYGWRGAAKDSIADLAYLLEAKTLPLTVTWRCPRSHVELARELVPDFEAAPDAAEGTVITGKRELIDQAQPGDLVLCRANAPIISACLHQIARRVPAVVRGRAIGQGLLKIQQKVERDSSPATIPDFVRHLARWKAREVARLEAKDGSEQKVEELLDQTAALEAIAQNCVSPAEIPDAVDKLFTDVSEADRVNFSSVHRAKGLEAPRVTYLQVPYSEQRDKSRPPQPWEHQQRKNLRYVALTRSLDTLTLVS